MLFIYLFHMPISRKPNAYIRNRKNEDIFHASVNTFGVALAFPTLGMSLLTSMITSLVVDGCINAYDNSFDIHH